MARRFRARHLALVSVIGLILAACADSSPQARASRAAAVAPSRAPLASVSAAASAPPASDVAAAVSVASTPAASAVTASDPNAALLATIAAATPLPSPTPVAGYVQGAYDIGGYSVVLSCQGVGSPTVMLVHGSSGSLHDWGTVQPELATSMHVCSYTRPPTGIGPQPRTAQTMVEELHTVLDVAGIAGPYVVVGHSWGGMVVRLYAHRYPAEVAGIVLVDAAVESPEATRQLFAFAQAADQRGEPWAREYLAVQKSLRDPQTAWEGVDFEVSVAQGLAVTSLGDLPVAVVSAGRLQRPPTEPPEFRELVTRLHREEQQALVGLSTRSFQIVATESGHLVQAEQPEAVFEAIRQVIAMAQ